MNKKKKTGLFFGSFNPIHTGHLILAGFMHAFTDLDAVWFVVSPQNPLKEKKSLLADHHRLSMVKIAIEEDVRFRAVDIEFNLPKPSYTIHTLAYMEEKYPDKDFVLLMGSDNIQHLHRWKNHEKLLEYYHIYVYPRPDYDGGEFIAHPRVQVVDAPLVEISSSFIRKAVKNKKNIRYMLPEKVYTYILEMHFYE